MDINRLRELRLKLNMTQADVGKQLGFTRQRYNFYETGKRQPDNDTLTKLAVFFNVSTDYLLGATDEPGRPDKKKESPLTDREALEEVLIKAGVIPADRDLTDQEFALLLGAAKGLFEGTD